jgi:dextranase
MTDPIISVQSNLVPTIEELRSFYRKEEEIALSVLPIEAHSVIARRADGSAIEAERINDKWLFALVNGTYNIEVFDSSGTLLCEEITTVGSHQGERPVHGFATSFQDSDVEEIIGWHRALRTTVVQIYDWMFSYTAPLGDAAGWKDPSNRPVSLTALQRMASELGSLGAVTHAYAPIYAVGNDFAKANPQMLLYEDNGEAIRFLDQIVIANPSNAEWQQHFVKSYGEAMDAIGFNGLHVDTYGYPRLAFDSDGEPVDMRAGYEAFLNYLRDARPRDLISFNQVNGVPSAANLPGGPWFRYCEIWPPNIAWRHFEGLLDRSSGVAGLVRDESTLDANVRGSLACYPPVWSVNSSKFEDNESSREESLWTVLFTDAIATMLGTSALIYGDKFAALCDPYYPKHAKFDANESATVIRWRRFALRCRDLFIDGEDTSWYEINDENGSVSVSTSYPVSPEPVGGGVFARVFQANDLVTVGVLDLTGSDNGLWAEQSRRGEVRVATVRVLLDKPEKWRVDAAVLGSNGDRFAPISSMMVEHRQGRALEIELPLVDGWSVVRVTPKNDVD